MLIEEAVRGRPNRLELVLAHCPRRCNPFEGVAHARLVGFGDIELVRIHLDRVHAVRKRERCGSQVAVVAVTAQVLGRFLEQRGIPACSGVDRVVYDCADHADDTRCGFLPAESGWRARTGDYFDGDEILDPPVVDLTQFRGQVRSGRTRNLYPDSLRIRISLSRRL
jgi:hypothetical protein